MFNLMYPKPRKGERDHYARAMRGGPIVSKFPEGLTEKIRYRDWTQTWLIASRRGDPEAKTMTLSSQPRWPEWKACVAPFVDGHAGPCRGRLTNQHVKTEVGMSVPRIHREEMLLTLCSGHHLDSKAGANWATAHMELQRDYLARLYREFWRDRIERANAVHQP